MKEHAGRNKSNSLWLRFSSAVVAIGSAFLIAILAIGIVRSEEKPLPQKNEQTARGPLSAVGLELVRVLKQQTPLERAYDVAFSPDGQLLGSAWQQVERQASLRNFLGNGTIRLWNVTTGELVRTLQQEVDRKNDELASVAFSPDGRLVAASSSVIGPSSIYVWELRTGTLLKRFPVKDSVRQLTFTPDGTMIASACDDGLVYVWDTATGKLVRTLKHPGIVVSVAFNPRDGKILAAGDYRQSVRIWDISNGNQIRILQSNPPSYGEAVAFSPDGQLLATGHASGQLRVWNSRTWQAVWSAENPKSEIGSVAFSPSGELLAATLGRSALRIWDPAKGGLLGSFDISDGSEPTRFAGTSVAFHPNLPLLATSLSGDYLKIWKINIQR